ncbi:MAG: DUF5780 domain-containing protein, partial [Acutalibacteraceae bacterium]
MESFNDQQKNETAVVQNPDTAPNVITPTKKKNPIYKKWWFWVIIAFVFIFLICIFASGDDTISTVVNDVNESELLAKIEEQEVKVVSTKLIVQDENSKVLYPDILSATVKNDSDYDIKNIVLAFVGWDKNNLPVKLINQFDYSDGAYVEQCSFNDVNLVPGEKFGDDSGFALSDDCTVDSFKAIVVSYETFEGKTWNNPYFGNWSNLYSGKKLASSENSVTSGDSVGDKAAVSTTTKKTLTKTELDAELAKQELKIVSQKYDVQSSEYKSLYPDMLQVILQNDTKHEIKTAVIAFVAWDKNNLPVKIVGQHDYSDGTYIKEVNYSDINLIPGAKFGDGYGFSLSKDC